VNGWAVYALVVIVGPMLLVVRWLVADSWRTRQRARCAARHANQAWSVAAITARVERERAEDTVAWPQQDDDRDEDAWPTDVLARVTLDDQPTEQIRPAEPPPMPKRPHVDLPYPWPRHPPPQRPDPELLRRIRDGLERW
jgi:hypothetical protein